MFLIFTLLTEHKKLKSNIFKLINENQNKQLILIKKYVIINYRGLRTVSFITDFCIGKK